MPMRKPSEFDHTPRPWTRPIRLGVEPIDIPELPGRGSRPARSSKVYGYRDSPEVAVALEVMGSVRDALAAVDAQREELLAHRARLVVEARQGGATYRQIREALGVSDPTITDIMRRHDRAVMSARIG